MCIYIVLEINLSAGNGWEMGSQIGKHQKKSLEDSNLEINLLN